MDYVYQWNLVDFHAREEKERRKRHGADGILYGMKNNRGGGLPISMSNPIMDDGLSSIKFQNLVNGTKQSHFLDEYTHTHFEQCLVTCFPPPPSLSKIKNKTTSTTLNKQKIFVHLTVFSPLSSARSWTFVYLCFLVSYLSLYILCQCASSFTLLINKAD